MGLKVSQLFNEDKTGWDLDKLNFHFFPEDVERIRKLNPCIEIEDFWCWNHTKEGAYKVKSGYWLGARIKNKELIREAESNPSLNVIKEKVWQTKTAPKIQTFMWKALSGAMTVAKELGRRGIRVDQRCQSCGGKEENVNHVLFTCPLARLTWAMSGIPIPPEGFDPRSEFYNFFSILQIYENRRFRKDITRKIPWLLWYMWKNRNELIFNEKLWDAKEVNLKVEEETEKWFVAQLFTET